MLAPDHGEGRIVLSRDEAAMQLEDDGTARGLGRRRAPGATAIRGNRRLGGKLLLQIKRREKEGAPRSA